MSWFAAWVASLLALWFMTAMTLLPCLACGAPMHASCSLLSTSLLALQLYPLTVASKVSGMCLCLPKPVDYAPKPGSCCRCVMQRTRRWGHGVQFVMRDPCTGCQLKACQEKRFPLTYGLYTVQADRSELIAVVLLASPQHHLWTTHFAKFQMLHVML